ncbi:MAG: hypothetical protein ACK4RN_13260 [Pseudorhodobacter sp.]
MANIPAWRAGGKIAHKGDVETPAFCGAGMGVEKRRIGRLWHVFRHDPGLHKG